LKDSNNNIILDYNINNLNLLTYSKSYNGKVSRKELEEHLFYKDELPDAIPWMHSYYSDNWGFCLTKNMYDNLNDDYYYVDIETQFEDDFLNIVELKIDGKSDKEVILTTYVCHPFMASDNVSGMYLLLKLYEILKDKDLKYNYRFLFFPETIGSLTSLSQELVIPDKVEYSLIATCVGFGDTINYKKTFKGNHSVDNIIESILSEFDDVDVRDYWPEGSDERQFSSPKIRIPTGTIMRSPYSEYPEYHTSADNLDLISLTQIKEMINIHKDVILTYENYPKYEVCHGGGEPFLSKYDLYRSLGGTHKKYDTESIRNWILFLSDGKNNIKDISKKSGFSESEIKNMVDILLSKNIIREV
jgi:aminopeptidase-like protein